MAPPPGNPRFPLFDGLRAIAVLAVVLYLVEAPVMRFKDPRGRERAKLQRSP